MNPNTLKSLCEKATQGPWYESGPLSPEESFTPGGTPPNVIAVVSEADDDGPAETKHVAEFDRERDQKLAVAAVNALPALLKLWEAAKLVHNANARRASAQVQDCCVREDYEQSMGYACDQLTRALEELEAL